MKSMINESQKLMAQLFPKKLKMMVFKVSSPSFLMKNDECVTYFVTKNGHKQIWYKDKDGWKQKSGKGIIRKVTAEQFLSHLLPALTSDYRNKVWVVVEKKKKSKKLI